MCRYANAFLIRSFSDLHIRTFAHAYSASAGIGFPL